MAATEKFPGFVTDLPEAALPFAGARAWLMQGDHHQVVFLESSETIDVPEHAHGDQWEIVLGGTVLLRMGGEAREYRSGEHFFIPAGTPHSAQVRAGYRALILFNERDRYRTK